MDVTEILKSLTGAFPEAISEATAESEIRARAYVGKEKAKEVCQYLKDSLQFDHLCSVCGVDYIKRNANWYERETYELFGIMFKNHPNLKPLILPEDMLGEWPLRKDYEGFPNKTARNLV